MSSKILIKILKALANDKRVKILKLLLSGIEMDVTEISEELKMPFRTVSQHLGKLRLIDLIEFRRQDLRNYYSVSIADQAIVRGLLRIVLKYYKD